MTEHPSNHVTVLPGETVTPIVELGPRVVVDGTFGGGGHTRRLLPHLPPDGRVIGLDRDPAVQARFDAAPFDDRVVVFIGSHRQSEQALASEGFDVADGLILDLGLSTDQLNDRSRGFSFQDDGPLDLRFDPTSGRSAADWLAASDERSIADAIYRFGEERHSRRVAREVVRRARSGAPVRTVAAMREVCERTVPRSKNHRLHPATRTFQSLRIVVNDELTHVADTLRDAAGWIRPGGVASVISFHSLEDRIVKRAFADDPRWEVITRKPITPSEAEIAANPRSRSAKLRIARVRSSFSA